MFWLKLALDRNTGLGNRKSVIGIVGITFGQNGLGLFLEGRRTRLDNFSISAWISNKVQKQKNYKNDEIYYDYIILYTKILYSSNIYTFTRTPRRTNSFSIFCKTQKKIKIEKKKTKRKRIPRNICATFAEIHLHFKRIAIKLYLLKLN